MEIPPTHPESGFLTSERPRFSNPHGARILPPPDVRRIALRNGGNILRRSEGQQTHCDADSERQAEPNRTRRRTRPNREQLAHFQKLARSKRRRN